MLQILDLSKRYLRPEGTVHALRDVSLRVACGEFVAVKGASGSGKTTLLLAAGGLLAPDGGQVLVDGRDVYAMTPDARARFRAERIGFVFQQFHLIPYLSVLDNVLAPALARPAPQAGERARSLIDRFGLSDRASHVPGELSTGERQRTALARALLHRPKLILADEPTGNLDGRNAETVLGHLAAFAEGGGAVLLVTHDPQAAGWAGRRVELREGMLAPV